MDALRLSSISASPHQKQINFFGAATTVAWITSKLFLFSFVLLKCPSTFSVWTSPHLFYVILFIRLSLLFYYSCVLLLYSYTNFLCKATSLSKTLFIVKVVSSLLTLPLIIFRIFYEVPLHTPRKSFGSILLRLYLFIYLFIYFFMQTHWSIQVSKELCFHFCIAYHRRSLLRLSGLTRSKAH